MIFVKRLDKPGKHSGYKLPPKASTEVRGLVITNQNNFPVWVDKMNTRKPRKKKKAKTP